MRRLPVVAASFLSVACIVPRGAAKAQLTASDLNVNARFGRMELAAESIAPEARQQFFEHRKAWGSRVRVADTELSSLQMKGSDDCDIHVRIAWYRVDDEELHMTTLRQKWHQYTEEWRLTGEDRADGDVGLIGEQMLVPPGEPKKNTQFPTVRIGAVEAPPSD
jgi:hypothetical protein